MTPIRRKASLHEKTVQKIARGEVEPKRKHRHPRRPRSSRVVRRHWSDGVDPLIVAWARRNGIHHSQIQVVSPTEIIVWNDGAPHPGEKVFRKTLPSGRFGR